MNCEKGEIAKSNCQEILYSLPSRSLLIVIANNIELKTKHRQDLIDTRKSRLPILPKTSIKTSAGKVHLLGKLSDIAVY